MKTKIFCAGVLGLLLTMVGGVSTASSQVNTTRVSTRQVQRLLTRIETKIEVLKDEADRAAARGGRQNQDSNSNISDLSRYLEELNTSVTRLDDSLDTRQPVDNDLREAMSDATLVDRYMTQNRVSVSAQAQWRGLKRDFNTLASYNRLSWNWNQTVPTRGTTIGDGTTAGYPGTRPYDISDSQIDALITRIQSNTELFEGQIMPVLNDTRTGSTSDARAMTDYITALETSTLRLKQHFDARQSTTSDVSDVLIRATPIDRFVSRNNLPYGPQAQWRNLRADLNNLAAGYRVSWNWNQTVPTYPGENNGPVTGRRLDTALSGTYRLNARLSDDVSAAVDRAVSSYSTTDQGQRDRLQRRLQSPEMIAIEKNSSAVSMASTNRPRVTFQADGTARTETSPTGRSITTTATADADSLIISYQGERANDFYVTFAPTANGQLRVTRRVYLENTDQPVTVSSVYDKVDNVARWNMITAGGDTTSAGVMNDTFVIPTGTRLNATLMNPISSTAVQTADRVVLEVTTPSQYRGARISGRIITEDASARTSGRSRVMISFDSIRLPNGQSYRFGGVINGVVSADGDNIAVAQQTAATTQNRAGVGNILGALIGAISGQPIEQTAATGVSGSILTQYRDAFSLRDGSQFIITASNDVSMNQLR